VKKISVFLNSLVESENIWPNTYKKKNFAMFPTARYKLHRLTTYS